MGRNPDRDRERRRRTRRALLEAGRSLLSQKAPGELTVRELAARSRTAVGTFYAYFDDVPHLVREVVREALAELRPRVAQARGIRTGMVAAQPAAAIARSFEIFFDLVDESPELTAILLRQRQAPGPEGDLVRSEIHDFAADLAEDLDRAVEAGWVAAEVDTDLAAHAVMAMTLALAERYATEPAAGEARRRWKERAVRTLTHIVLRGLADEDFLPNRGTGRGLGDDRPGLRGQRHGRRGPRRGRSLSSGST